MSDTDPSDDEVVWKLLAMRLASELPTEQTVALRVLTYMAEWLHHLNEMKDPIIIETDHIVLQFNSKKKA